MGRGDVVTLPAPEADRYLARGWATLAPEQAEEDAGEPEADDAPGEAGEPADDAVVGSDDDDPAQRNCPNCDFVGTEDDLVTHYIEEHKE